MRPQLVRAVLLAHELHHRANVTFWLECGSMLGGSLTLILTLTLTLSLPPTPTQAASACADLTRYSCSA